MLDNLVVWHAELNPESAPLLCNDGSTRNPERASETGDLLNPLYDELAEMGGRVTDILRKTGPLSERLEDAGYLVACLAWCVYALDNTIRADISFGELFGDHDLLKIRLPQVDDSKKDIETVSSILIYLKSEVSSENELYDLIQSMSKPLPDGDIKGSTKNNFTFLHLSFRPFPDRGRGQALADPHSQNPRNSWLFLPALWNAKHIPPGWFCSFGSTKSDPNLSANSAKLFFAEP